MREATQIVHQFGHDSDPESLVYALVAVCGHVPARGALIRDPGGTVITPSRIKESRSGVSTFTAA